MIRRKLTLEERVARLEKLLAKNEDFKTKDNLANTIANAMYVGISKIDPFSEGCEIELDEIEPCMDGGGNTCYTYRYNITLDDPSLLKKYNGLGALEMKIQTVAKKVWNSIDDPRMMFFNANLSSKGYVYLSISLAAPGFVAELAPGDDGPNYRDMERSAEWLKWQREPGSSTLGR